MFARLLRMIAAAALPIALVGFSPVVAADAGQVEFVRGTGALQRAARLPLFLARGMVIAQGDTITTGPDSHAILKLTDGTRMTVIANSTLVLQTYTFNPAVAAQGEAGGGMVIGLLKGGLRTLTGLLPKQHPEAARIITPSATVGIRGTDFDVRVCARECQGAAANASVRPAAPLSIQASARIIRMQGQLSATASTGLRRLLAQGGAVYQGDVIESAAGTYAVLAFRDESVLTIQASSTVRIDDFVFDRANPGEGRVLVNLVKGGLRALSGLIGQANPRNVNYRLPNASVGIRGTGTDMYVGVCPVEGALTGPDSPMPYVGVCPVGAGGATSENTESTVVNWQGSNSVTADATTCSSNCSAQVDRGESVIVNTQGVTKVAEVPSYMNFDATTPRPDQVPYDRNNLWGVSANSEDPEAVYVFVRDGDIRLIVGNKVLDLGRNEAGFVAGLDVQRLEGLPPQLIWPASGMSPIDQFRQFMCSR